MRSVLLLALLATACSKGQPPAPAAPLGSYASGRDRLCIAGEGESLRAGLIVYGPDDANCSASGRLEPAGEEWVLVPHGEGACRIPLRTAGGTVTLGAVSPACAYYCGPGASLAGRSFSLDRSGAEAADLGGDPLC